ncbi:hypothetical protein [Hydrogenophaga sp.]|uniref:hypothetical protein n=1 Tax=Hydrogenophaga sp. TaxID=1904254 RepID=UPI002FC86FFF
MTTKKPVTKTVAAKKPAVKTAAKKTSAVKTPAVKRIKAASAETMKLADQQVAQLKKGSARIVMPELKTKVAGEKVKADGPPSKMSLATELYNKHKAEGRKVVLAAFIEQAKLTKAGANTYYANLKKKLG